MMKMKHLLMTIWVLLSSLTLFAQNTIRVEAPNLVELNEQFNVTFIIEGESRPKDFEWSQGPDFQLVWGPQTGSSTSIQILNGKRTKSSQYTFTYILSPKKAGTFQLPEATAMISGEKWTSQTATIEVVGSGTQPSASSSGQSSSGQSSSGSSESADYAGEDAGYGDISQRDLFLQLSLSKREAVVGEPITATLKLYQRVSIAGFEDAKFPSFNGFWSQETYTPTNIQFNRENVNDMIYNSAVLRKYIIIPQQVGTLSIEPSELVCLVNVRAPQRHSNSIFDSFFDDGYRTIRKRVTTPQINVRVKSLPAGAPASYGGGVGSFKVQARVSKDSLKMHEAASLLFTVSGKGNVSLLDAPKVALPPDFELYDTKTTDRTEKSSGGTSGSKTFEFPFIPRSYGDFEIPPIEYAYYDVDAGKYVQLTTAPIRIKVAKGKVSTSAGNSDPGNLLPQIDRKGVKNLGEDIRFIQTKLPRLDRGSKFLVAAPAYWVLVAVFVLIALVVFFIFRKLGKMKADVAGTRNRGAVRMARKRLKAAQEYLNKNLYSAFYEELHRGLSDFIADKFNLQMEDLNKDRISARLQEEGIPEELTGRLVKLLDACEYARYSPDSDHDAMNSDYEEAVSVVSSIGSGMKTKKKSNPAAALILFMLLVPSFMMNAAESYPDSLWTMGTRAYEAGQWEEAARSWSAITAAGIESPEVYYNIGNAYFKSNEMAKAIIHWERALKLDPSYSDARFNLEFAQHLIQDRIDPVPEFILTSLARKVSYWLESDSWAILSLICFVLVLGGLLIFFLCGRRGWRIASFYLSIVLLLASAGCFGFARWQLNDYRRADRAIVMKPVSSIKSSPSAGSSKDLFVLHEGTKVQVLDKIGDWYNISLADGRQGWICAADMEII